MQSPFCAELRPRRTNIVSVRRSRLPAVFRQMEKRTGRRSQTGMAAAGRTVLARSRARTPSAPIRRMPSFSRRARPMLDRFTLQGKTVTADFAPDSQRDHRRETRHHSRASARHFGKTDRRRTGKFAVACDRARSACRHPAERPRQRRSASISRPTILSLGHVVSRDRHLAAFRWKTDRRCSQCAR